ncbi:hypothetical protein GPECTOR_9g634 [Gonium pectorale]|uniref:Uncharacterized protein n=1 Tax=Gonium pectorale TaxID=33097 RepID=A0A150GRW9_GONPE|nr:hypothetical protein GPECTOR_9g634 [Gonium pectorale]|eukprot:KXZ52589.1 hypothetical protein GPECTOR_9g634 [Gonium pectorale]
MEGRPAAGAPAAFLLTNVTGNIAYSYVLLTPSVPEVKTNACDFPLLPGCDVGGGSAEAANTSAPLAAPAAALPYLCRLRPEGAAAEATPLEYAFRAGRITDSIYPLDVGDLENRVPVRLVVQRDAGFSAFSALSTYSAFSINATDEIADYFGMKAWEKQQAPVSLPATLLGDPAGPRLLNLSARPALINLRSPLASLTLRDLVLQELLLLAWVVAHSSTAIVTDPRVAEELAALARDSQMLRPDLVRAKLAATDLIAVAAAPYVARPQLASITFGRFCWCGLQGRNVTLAAELPYAAAQPYVAWPRAASLSLPVDWSTAAAAEESDRQGQQSVIDDARPPGSISPEPATSGPEAAFPENGTGILPPPETIACIDPSGDGAVAWARRNAPVVIGASIAGSFALTALALAAWVCVVRRGQRQQLAKAPAADCEGGTAPTADLANQIKGGTAPTADLANQIKGGTAPTADLANQIKGGTAPTADLANQIKGGDLGVQGAGGGESFSWSSGSLTPSEGPSLQEAQLGGCRTGGEASYSSGGRQGLSESKGGAASPGSSSSSVYQSGSGLELASSGGMSSLAADTVARLYARIHGAK